MLHRRLSAALAAALMTYGAAASAHNQNTGSPRAWMDAFMYDSEDGYYQYAIIWEGAGNRHHTLMDDQTNFQTKTTSAAQWPATSWLEVYDHVGVTQPVPVGLWHRVKVCAAVHLLCWPSFNSNQVYIPRRRCEGSAIH